MRSSGIVAMVMGVAILAGCTKEPVQLVELKHFPLDDLEGIIAGDGVAIDSVVSSDGHGSLRVTTTEPRVIRLYELIDPGFDDARLVYRARLRTEGVDGQVFIEALCRFPGKGQFFARSLDHPLSGDSDWSTEETIFYLQPGDMPDRVLLNLIIEGTGTVWIDDIHVLKGPLEL